MSSNLCLQWQNISMSVEKRYNDWIHCKRIKEEHKILQNGNLVRAKSKNKVK